MPLFDSILQRFSQRLELHQIDDDYTTPSRTSSRESNINANASPNTDVHNYDRRITPYSYHTVESYDPTEPVPSYESSQLLHERRQRVTERGTSLPGSSNISRDISRSSSFAALPHTGSTGTPSNSNIGGHSTNIGRKGNNNTLKSLGLKFLNARQHFALALSRDVSLIPCIIGLYQSWNRVFFQRSVPADLADSVVSSITSGSQHLQVSVTGARLSEHFLTGIWCIVSGYLSFSVLEGLMVRWIVTYLTLATIVRMLSMSAMIVTIELYLVSVFTAEGSKYALHIWIMISCCLTLLFIIQNFVTLNLDLKGKTRARFFDFYTIAVFAVVPIGLASFITMVGLLRSLIILRLDIDQNGLPVATPGNFY